MSDKYTPAPITTALMNISAITGNGVDFIKLRFELERFEKEAKEGNVDSQALIDIVYRFEKLIKVLLKNKSNTDLI